MSDPLPCPFCAGDRIVSGFIRDGRQVSCRKCGAAVQEFNPNAEAKAWAAWNRRAQAPGLAAAIDALGCFWNAALYATHDAQDATANAVMRGMVEGVAAVAERLKQHAGAAPTYTERAGLPEALLSSVLLGALKTAEQFMAGFEDDRHQVGIAGQLELVRAAIRQAEAARG